jgi:RNA polymerase sigma factor (sigma-70 family)
MRREDTQADGSEELAGVLAGDPAAIDRWYRAQHPAVWRLCLGFLGSAAEAEDVAQEAMLKLHDTLKRWDSAQAYRPWRNTVVLNLCRDRVRRIQARARAEERAAELADWRVVASPSSNVEQRELRELLHEALITLSEREREAFVLRELEGLGTGEVAQIMGVGESSVRSLLTLARRRLRDRLAKQLPELAGGEDE